MRKLIVIFILFVATSAQALTIDYERQSGYNSSSGFGWFYSYDLAFIDDAIQVDVDIRLTGATTTLLGRWESGIESIWSTNRFAVPILFNVDWVSEGWDYSVNVTDSTGRWNMRNWYTIGGSGWGDSFQEEVVAHEFGHMLGAWDEYVSGAIDPITRLVNTGGLMHTLTGSTLDYYYDDILDWYETKLDSTHNDVAPVPEPSTLILLGIGMLGLAIRSKRGKVQNAAKI